MIELVVVGDRVGGKVGDRVGDIILLVLHYTADLNLWLPHTGLEGNIVKPNALSPLNSKLLISCARCCYSSL